MKRTLVALVLIARPLVAGYASRDLVLPIAGRTLSGGGQLFLTTVWITNVAPSPAKLTLSFLQAGRMNQTPHRMLIEIGPGATRVFDPLDASVMGTSTATGALRIQSSADVAASARVSTGDVATSYAGVPTRFAIGNGQSTVVHGFDAQSRYKLYVVETTGEPLAYSVIVSDASGRICGEKRLFIDRLEQRSIDLSELFPKQDSQMIRITGTNGSGKIVVMGLQMMPGHPDANAFEMSFPTPSRFAISWTEGLTYAIVALAVIAAALTRR
jgi:hypothetical protein